MATKPKRKIHQYTEENMAAALMAIRKGMGINKASRQYGVPRGTIHGRLTGRVAEGPRRMGPTPYLTQAEEAKIVEWCIKLTKCGFPRKDSDILNSVQQMITDDNRETPFKKGRPGRKWFSAFLKRNPILLERTVKSISKGGAEKQEKYIRNWFTDLKNYLVSINSFDVLNDSNRIFNVNETSFSTCPKTSKVLAPKAYKNVYTINVTDEKETITVLMVISASGQTLPPLVVFPYKRTPKEILKSIPDHWFLGKSDSGWMSYDTFYDYIVNGVDKWLKDENIAKPVILFVDGLKSHLTLSLSEYCFNNNIILYALPQNTTNMMQPAELSVFKPLKQQWKKTMREFLSLPENCNCIITKSNICSVFKMVLDRADLIYTIQHAFKCCGLYPFDPNAVDYTKCIQTIRKDEPTVPSNISEEEIKTTLSVINKIKHKLIRKGFKPKELISEIIAATNYALPSKNDQAEAKNKIIEDEDTTLEQEVLYNFDTFIIPCDTNRTDVFGETTMDIDQRCPNSDIDMLC